MGATHIAGAAIYGRAEADYIHVERNYVAGAIAYWLGVPDFARGDADFIDGGPSNSGARIVYARVERNSLPAKSDYGGAERVSIRGAADYLRVEPVSNGGGNVYPNANTAYIVSKRDKSNVRDAGLRLKTRSPGCWALLHQSGRLRGACVYTPRSWRNLYLLFRDYFTLAKVSSDRPLSPSQLGKALLSSGVEIDCAFREIQHPEGRFRREDGTRYDLCVLEVLADPSLRPPAVSREQFVGDGADNLPVVIRLGNVRQSSFRVRLISPGAAFGTMVAAGKSTASLAG